MTATGASFSHPRISYYYYLTPPRPIILHLHMTISTGLLTCLSAETTPFFQVEQPDDFVESRQSENPNRNHFPTHWVSIFQCPEVVDPALGRFPIPWPRYTSSRHHGEHTHEGGACFGVAARAGSVRHRSVAIRRERKFPTPSRADLSFLGIGSSSERDLTTLETRRETKQDREARRLERERLAREKERERSMREEHVDGGYLVTQGVYVGPEDFNKAVVRQLMV